MFCFTFRFQFATKIGLRDIELAVENIVLVGLRLVLTLLISISSADVPHNLNPNFRYEVAKP